MIKDVIYSYWEEKLPEVIERDTSLDSSNLINDLVGIRRCGKTFLMYSEIRKLLTKVDKKSTIFISFENRRLFPLKSEYFNEIIAFIYAEKMLERGKVYLFLDEVQKIEGWEQYVRSIYDEFKGKIKIFVSGSNAHLLSKDYGALLTGRHLSTTLMPLSFKEFLVFKNYELGVLTEKNKATLQKVFEEYLTFGGFPDVVLSENKEQMLGQLFDDILSRDILSKKVRKETVLEEFSYYLSANVASLLSFNRMADYFKSRGIKISVQTIQSYFELIKNSFMFYDNLIFSHKIKDKFQNPRKLYCIDNGLFNFLGFKFSHDYGKLYENAVFIKLKRMSFATRSMNLSYWKNALHEEVDFVVKEGLKVNQLIQVCYDLEKPDTRKRELRALMKASAELKCNNLLVITKDYEGQEIIDKKKIHFVPLWAWSLR